MLLLKKHGAQALIETTIAVSVRQNAESGYQTPWLWQSHTRNAAAISLEIMMMAMHMFTDSPPEKLYIALSY